MVGIKYTIDDRAAGASLKQAERRLDHPEQALKKCGLVLLRSIAQNFKAGGRPVRWHPSKRARISGGQTLVATARLMRSITREVLGKVLRVGTSVKYAAIHQFGGRIRGNVTVKAHYRFIMRAFGKPITGRKVMVRQHTRNVDIHIRQRKFLLVQDSDRRVMGRIVAEYTTTGER